MEDYLKFNKFITPTFIQILFWLGVVGILFYTFTLVSAASQFGGGGAGTVLGAFLAMIFMIIFWRVYCEIMLVLFKILAELQALRKAKVGTPEPDSSAV
ncbi:MAG: DUF4282 domain-containing protein [Parasphingopyxis sp.]|nr:DUF4282 domain-containing protein [Sphingomonadales bacterium]